MFHESYKHYCDVCDDFFNVEFQSATGYTSYCPSCGEILINHFVENDMNDLENQQNVN